MFCAGEHGCIFSNNGAKLQKVSFEIQKCEKINPTHQLFSTN